ncbi:MAG: hypothetical protein IT452_21905, partial [Planctomycetia bacterium]|nr:hypothetical protein [Planctomycetia bacterium]
MNAETAYVFRHALLREAARQLQMPGDRARLHAVAFGIVEEMAGGPPGERPALDRDEEVSPDARPADAWAAELAEHAAQALHAPQADQSRFAAARREYLRRAAEHAQRQFRWRDASG